ncbi:helix-turn-helix transcriptional regulator [Bacillus mojavensis]|uniref:helix-turn-helix domain-containing protein n=1 Tax=Bacillus mojavensis TaxID=72360 RepID=UPI002DB910C7|nr:helix-turn-helix transcriptional regulator [Bacillus mojavensis]MEC1288706.1 helix-turn-helix transcriptional regulator [Bacillus mojavensis]MEC1613732.1 helix-turn-helix transcriptional regulator [Bacillus mojavensis]MEC1620483.1 helix-turn-helix transcriptional regulator [Bacillus mojavensis]MEC1634412.1 helix-turn-helix transcriptional regulator [Bacillus mojavensis]MEC1658188.1 helix-turn-helix transcriptional regulator [Bacillus mojavensis]
MSTFGQELRALRRARKLTVNQLAVYSGISSATISKIENGKRGTPKPATIKKLAAVLKIPHENLMAAAGHITAFPEEIREASEGYQSIYAIYQTAVTRGAGNLSLFNSKEWNHLSKKDIENLSKYFDFLASEAKKRSSST